MPTTIDFSQLNLPFGADVWRALAEDRVLFWAFETPDDAVALFAIGRDLDRMRHGYAASAFSSEKPDWEFFILIDDDHLEGFEQNLGVFESTAPVIDGAGNHVGEIPVLGGRSVPVPTKFGEWSTAGVLFEQIKEGQVFAVGERDLDDPGVQVLYRALEDYNPAGTRLHILTKDWDTLSDEQKLEETAVAELVPPTMLVFAVFAHEILLEEAGVKDITGH